MKDKYGEEILEGDLVYILDNQTLTLAIDSDMESVNLWHNAYGECRRFHPHSVMKIHCSPHHATYRIWVGLIQSLADKEQKKKLRQSTRIKKGQFKRYHVYTEADSILWGSEIYLGPAVFENVKYDDLWLSIRWEEEARLFHSTKITVDMINWVAPTWYARDCKFPLKHIDLGSVPEWRVHKFPCLVLEAMKEDLILRTPWTT